MARFRPSTLAELEPNLAPIGNTYGRRHLFWYVFYAFDLPTLPRLPAGSKASQAKALRNACGDENGLCRKGSLNPVLGERTQKHTPPTPIGGCAESMGGCDNCPKLATFGSTLAEVGHTLAHIGRCCRVWPMFDQLWPNMTNIL